MLVSDISDLKFALTVANLSLERPDLIFILGNNVGRTPIPTEILDIVESHRAFLGSSRSDTLTSTVLCGARRAPITPSTLVDEKIF